MALNLTIKLSQPIVLASTIRDIAQLHLIYINGG